MCYLLRFVVGIFLSHAVEVFFPFFGSSSFRYLGIFPSGSSASQDTFRESFMNLVNSRLVERCPSAEPLIPLPSQDEPPAKRGRAAKFAVREVTLEERALAAAIPMDAERFSIADSLDSDEDNIGNNSSSVKVGSKRKHASVQWDSELDSNGGKKEPLWRVNFDEFINRLRIKACIEYARAEYDNAAAMILRSMLEGTKCSESTVCMSLESVFEEAIKTEEGRKMTLEHVRSSLEEMRFCSEADGMYTIDLTDIIKSAQLEEVESIVLKKYDPGTFRIFRTLSSGRQLDTDKISDETFVDKKETPVNLFKLWKDNYVQMEKISTGVARQADIFLWRVKKDNLWEQILDDLYHAALNLIIRNNYEVERDREIISRTKQQMDMEAKQLKQVRNLLAASLMKLDDAIMLFYDFL